MSAAEVIGGSEPVAGQAVRLLYVCDWPPSNFGGGPILMSRLLREYPPDTITVLTSTRFARISPKEGRLECDEITVPLSEGYGRFGLGRLRLLLNWLRIPVIAWTARRVIRQREIAAIFTVLHGQFCFAAALAGWITDVPYIVIVHDDYVTQMNCLGRWLSRAVLRGAAHIYCVSPGMQETLLWNFGVESELQLPGTESPQFDPVRPQNEELSIVYAGAITVAVEDSLRAVAGVITSGKLSDYGVQRVKLHLYTALKDEQKLAWRWNQPDIVIHSWVGQHELAQVLRKADVLFLPFSFAPEARHMVETAFPSKTADYLASGTPIVVFGPNYSSLVAYARREAFAEIVTEPDEEQLARAIRRIALDPGRRQVLSSRALAVFSKYHNIGQQRADFLRVLDSIVGERSGEKVSRRL
jgi:glycosyltransferase involved in cell wall biosynthesis